MFELTEDDIRLKLLANVPIEVNGIGYLSLPSLRQIISMNESLHSTYLSYLLFSKNNIDGHTEELNSLTDFQILSSFVYHEDSFRKSFFNALEMIFGEKPNCDEGVVYFGELRDESVFTEEKWDFVKKIVKIGNFVEDKKEEEYKAGNEKARKLIEEIRKKKAKRANKEIAKQNLHSLISAISWKTVGIATILDLTVYQLYDAYMRLENINQYEFTLTGIYTGNIDGSKIQLPDINWANIIKTK